MRQLRQETAALQGRTWRLILGFSFGGSWKSEGFFPFERFAGVAFGLHVCVGLVSSVGRQNYSPG
ncbi:hypothetical protein [Roseateles sp.]|uniref:hypothetical protein n=1 Tax=Roseateles sp. TaxID=1971397 RepID=UPI003BAC3C1E